LKDITIEVIAKNVEDVESLGNIGGEFRRRVSFLFEVTQQENCRSRGKFQLTYYVLELFSGIL